MSDIPTFEKSTPVTVYPILAKARESLPCPQPRSSTCPFGSYCARAEEYDAIGFGYPIYGSDCPQIYWEFLKTLPKININKNVLIYTSMLAFSGDGALVAEKYLRKKGYMIKQAVNTHMPNNLKLPYPVIDQFPIYDEEQKAKILRDAEFKIIKLVKRIVNNEEWVEGRGLIGILGGVFQRFLVVFTGWSRWARNFFVDYDACIHCNQCMEYCPTENISLVEERIHWGVKCICCLRCYNMCPTDAIQYKKATLDRIKFPRYKGPMKEFNINSMMEE